MFGICFEGSARADEFEYYIADVYNPLKEVPLGFTTREIPKNTWAVFACKGPMPNAIQDVTNKIFSEWLPNCKDYEIAADYTVEMYSDISDYPNGNEDVNYYSEVWVPVKRK